MEPHSTACQAARLLHVEPITDRSAFLDHVHELYNHAFPAKERSPFQAVLHESGEFIAFFDGELFCGFASLLTFGDITHILYFAIDGKLRDHGYGSAALRTMRAHLPGQRLIADIESENENAVNGEQRLKRKRFYMANGYREAGIRYRWEKEDYEILVNGGDISSKEFETFWHHFKLEGKAPKEY